MVFRRAVVLPLLLVAGACGDDGSMPIDAPVDAVDAPPDVDNGTCGTQLRFTGEYIDWDQNSFCGIFNATLTVAGGGASDTTAPNGRFDLCVPDAPTARLDVTQPTANSECTVPASSYTIPTILFTDKSVLQSGAGAFSARAFTVAREATFFADNVGAAFDPTKAQVFVHVGYGSPDTVTIGAAHGTALVASSTGWTEGTTGSDVFFPNVDVGAGTTVVTGTNGGSVTIPLEAGTITSVTIFGGVPI